MPFGLKFICDKLYVTFAKQDDARIDGVPGLGNGYVDIFDADGVLLSRFINRGPLNEPWAILPCEVAIGEKIVEVILVGNFGDGRINMFSCSGTFLGCAMDKYKNDFSVDGLWGIFCTKDIKEKECKKHKHSSDVDYDYITTLYFVAGINDEMDGLLGKLVKIN